MLTIIGKINYYIFSEANKDIYNWRSLALCSINKNNFYSQKLSVSIKTPVFNC